MDTKLQTSARVLVEDREYLPPSEALKLVLHHVIEDLDYVEPKGRESLRRAVLMLQRMKQMILKEKLDSHDYWHQFNKGELKMKETPKSWKKECGK
jgi:hypothetical protein